MGRSAVPAGRYVEEARSYSVARPHLHDILRVKLADEVGAHASQQAVLGPGQVVLRKLRDLLEQPGSHGVVEVLRRQRLGVRGEASTHVLHQLAEPVLLVDVDVNLVAHDRSRRPPAPPAYDLEA
jgi:hypothetical protein